MTYEEQINSNPIKMEIHQMLDEFPSSIQALFIQKYSVIFNFYEEADEERLNMLKEKLQAALVKLHTFHMKLYGDCL